MNEEQTKELLAKVKEEANNVLETKNFADAETVKNLKETIDKASTAESVKAISDKMDIIAQDFEALKEKGTTPELD